MENNTERAMFLKYQETRDVNNKKRNSKASIFYLAEIISKNL